MFIMLSVSRDDRCTTSCWSTVKKESYNKLYLSTSVVLSRNEKDQHSILTEQYFLGMYRSHTKKLKIDSFVRKNDLLINSILCPQKNQDYYVEDDNFVS